MTTTRYAAKSRPNLRRQLAFGVALSLIAPAASVVPGASLAGAPRVDAEQYRVVDCLLPGQVRKLGRAATFMTPRRPIRTSGVDCEIRGGEYVSADRAGFESSMAVWRPSADAGDAKAMAYVGRIYAEGFGRAPDYEMAAVWYKKASDNGYAPAMIDLGQLYEQGQGVPRDQARAVALYRQASGLPEATFQRASAPVGGAAMARLNDQVLQAQQQARANAAELEAARAALAQERAALQTTRADLERANAAARTPARATEDAELRRALDRKNEELIASQRRADALAADLAKARSNTQPSRPVGLDRQLTDAQAAHARTQQERDAAQAELKTLRDRLDASNRQLEAMNSRTKTLEQTLASTRNNQQQQSKRADAERELEAVRKSADEARRTANATSAQLKSAGTDLSSKDAQLAASAAKLADAEQRIAALRSDGARTTKTLEDQVRQAQAASQKLQTERDDARRQLEAQQRQLATSQDSQRKSDTSTAALSKSLAEREAKLAAREAKVRELEAESRKTQADFRTSAVAPVAAAPSLGRPTALSAYGFGTQYVLLIGETSYRDTTLPKLTTPAQDVTELGRIFQSRYGFDSKVLIDATRSEILGALDAMSKKITEKDTLIIYYAGHGNMEKVRSGQDRGYWLPIDGKMGSTADQISNQEITFQVARMAARKVLIISDSCYSGMLTTTVREAQSPSAAVANSRDFLIGMARKQSRNVMTSGGLEPVLDSGSGKHSVFASALIEILSSNRDVLTSAELYDRILPRVMADATRTLRQARLNPNPQQPQYSALDNAGHQFGDFLFIPRTPA